MLSNKVVVITGGVGLLGKEFVREVIKNNGIAIITDVNNEACSTVLHEMVSAFGKDRVDSVLLDITSPNSIKKAIKMIKEKFGTIDALVNNAYPRNKNYGKHFFDVQIDDFNENVNLNLGGYFLASQLFSAFFKEQGGGNIINISSIYGVVAPRFDIYEDTSMTTPVEYAVIKSGLIHLTKYMAKYLKGCNIRVNSLSPGGVFNSQPEDFLKKYKSYCLNKGMLNPSDMVGTLVFLLSDMSKHINGQNIVVDDGFTL